MTEHGVGRHRNPMGRDSRFELLRIGAMFLIVLCHVVVYNGWALEDAPGVRGSLAIAVDQYGGQVGVSLFFMLSGYFLVGKPPRRGRITKVLVQTFLYSVACFIAAVALAPTGPAVSVRDWYMTFLPFLNDVYWFITAYVLMMAFYPFLNMLFEHCTGRSMLTFIALLLSLSVIPYVSFTGFRYNGLFWTTVVYAVCGYCVGGWIRLYGSRVWDRPACRLPWVLVGGCAGFVLLAMFVHAAREQWGPARFFSWQVRSIYGSFPLFAIEFAAMLLLWVARVSSDHGAGEHPTLSRVINAVAASTFGVYLIHQNPYASFRLIWPALSSILPSPPHGFIAITAFLTVETIVLFAVLSLASMVYDRILVRPMQRLVLKVLPGMNNGGHPLTHARH